MPTSSSSPFQNDEVKFLTITVSYTNTLNTNKNVTLVGVFSYTPWWLMRVYPNTKMCSVERCSFSLGNQIQSMFLPKWCFVLVLFTSFCSVFRIQLITFFNRFWFALLTQWSVIKAVLIICCTTLNTKIVNEFSRVTDLLSEERFYLH